MSDSGASLRTDSSGGELDTTSPTTIQYRPGGWRGNNIIGRQYADYMSRRGLWLMTSVIKIILRGLVAENCAFEKKTFTKTGFCGVYGLRPQTPHKIAVDYHSSFISYEATRVLITSDIWLSTFGAESAALHPSHPPPSTVSLRAPWSNRPAVPPRSHPPE